MKNITDMFRSVLGAYRTLFIDPNEVCGHVTVEQKDSLKPFLYPFSGVFLDGDWDKAVKRKNFRETKVFKSCEMRWHDGLAWRDTPIYQVYEKQILDGQPHGDAPTIKALKERYETMDRIFERVLNESKLSDRRSDLVRISFARDGSLFWGPNGRHRLAMAILADLDLMPGRVLYVHPQAGQAFKKALE